MTIDPDLPPHAARILREHTKLVEEKRRNEEERAAELAEREREALSPVQRPRSNWSGCSLALLLFTGWVLAIFVFAELAMTVGRYQGPSIGEAERTGDGTVVSCKRHGPVGWGLGYWYGCTARVVWEDGEREIITINKAGYFHRDDIGKTIRIGDLGTDRHGHGYTTENVSSRPWLTAVGVVLALIAGFLFIPLAWILWGLMREGWRKLTRRPARDLLS